MRLFIAVYLLCSFMCACTNTSASLPTKQNKQVKIIVIKTPEIIRILEKESIVSISTTHSQSIYIRLKDGSRYKGKYIPKEAGKYSTITNLSDILNLVVHIKKQRPPDEVKEWRICCE